MPRALIVYASSHGQTREVSHRIVYTDWSRVDDFADRALALCHHGSQIVDENRRSPDAC